MDFDKFEIIQTNITIVYETLNLEAIDRNALRRELVEGIAPVVTEIPDAMIGLVYPQLQMACLLGDRRIRINDGSQLPIGERPIAIMVMAANKLVGGKVVAYGLNYEVVVPIQSVEISGVFLRDRFLRDPDEIEAQINGLIQAISLRLQYSRDNTMYRLAIEPEAETRIKAHLNVHFEKPKELPDAEILQASFKREFDGFLTTLKAL